jgi:hypothetical protein
MDRGTVNFGALDAPLTVDMFELLPNGNWRQR